MAKNCRNFIHVFCRISAVEIITLLVLNLYLHKTEVEIRKLDVDIIFLTVFVLCVFWF